MKKLTLALVAATALTSAPVLAADLRMPVKAPVMAPVAAFNWSGFYIGGFVGGAFADGDVRATELGSVGAPALGYNVGFGLGVPWTYPLDSSFIGGGTIGWNFQAPGSMFVFGLEAEAGYVSLRGFRADPASPGLDTVSRTQIGDWYAVLAGRLGLAFDRTLIYVKGGGAFVDVRSQVIDNCTLAPCGPATVNARGRADEFTWAAGGGLEFALSYNWSIKAEYLYIDTSSTFNSCGPVAAAAGQTFCWRHDVPGLHTAKVGINYRFGGPVVASY
jgi:outer membrane immunogenic protein